MSSPPLRTAAIRCGIVCLLVVSVASAVGVGAADTSGEVVAADRSPSQSCEYDDYTPPELGSDWTATYEDALAADSQARWDGGRVVRVGAGGDCSLFVADGRTATVADVTVNGTRGIVTGTIDLGADGQFRLVDAAAGQAPSATDAPTSTATASAEPPASTATMGRSTPSTAEGPSVPTTARPTASTTSGLARAGTETEAVASGRPTDGAATEANATGLVIANDGPDYSTTAVVTVGNRSENVSLPSGRFFDVAVQRTSNGTVRVAVWEPDGTWDREWDARFEDAGTAAWGLELRGRAFLDGIAVGVPRTDDAQRATASPEDDDDNWPGPGTWPGEGGPRDGPRHTVGEGGGDGGSGAGSIFLGLLVTAFGALGVKFAYEFALFGEQLDAIGSKRRASEVEPAEWNVALTRIGFGLLALFGLYLIGSGLL